MSVAQAFVGLPIETLILDPIVACAKGQAQLAEVTLDFVNQLAFEPPDPKAKDPNERKTKQLKVSLERLANSTDAGAVATVNQQINMPLLPLVQIPNFALDTMKINFNMEIKTSTTAKSSSDSSKTKENESSAKARVSGGFWGVKFSGEAAHSSKTTATVAAHKENTRSSDQSAKYEIEVTAKQLEPAEGMARFTQILASVIEPIEVGTS